VRVVLYIWRTTAEGIKSFNRKGREVTAKDAKRKCARGSFNLDPVLWGRPRTWFAVSALRSSIPTNLRGQECLRRTFCCQPQSRKVPLLCNLESSAFESRGMGARGKGGGDQGTPCVHPKR